jgi:DNA-binding GntR family transcriptional regulator
MSRAAEKDSPASLRSQLVSRMLHSIFSGELRGGDRLVEADLARRFGVSRTPIREALGELAAIGVISMRPNHGAIVCPFGPTQLSELYHVRRVLEVEATRTANVDRGALEQIRGRTQLLIDQSDRSEHWAEQALAIDQQFHWLISHSSGNDRLGEEIGKYRTLVVAVGNAVGNKLYAHDQNMSEHLTIIGHLLNGRRDDAAEAMGRHIMRGAATAAEVLGPHFEQSAVPNHRRNGDGRCRPSKRAMPAVKRP